MSERVTSGMEATGERQVGVSFRDIRLDHRARYEWAATFVDEDSVVLDAGCGVGYGACLLAAAKASVWALDRDTQAIDYAREHWQNEAVSYRVANITTCDFPTGMNFDLVVAFEIIEHLVAPELFLRNLHRVTGPDSRLLLSVPNQSFVSHSVELNPFYIRHYTQAELQELVGNCGFQVEQVFCQDEKEIVQGIAGRTLLALCRPDTANSARFPELRDLQKALDIAESEIIVRADAIQRLQALNGRWSEERPGNLGTLQLSIRERAAQVAAQTCEHELARVRGAWERNQQELIDLRRAQGETVAMLNRANIALEIYGTRLEKAHRLGAEQASTVEHLRKEITSRTVTLERKLKQQASASDKLLHDLKAIKRQQRSEKEFFDPDAPTLAGLFRLVRRHRLFLAILPRATLNSLRNFYHVYVKPKIGSEAFRK